MYYGVAMSSADHTQIVLGWVTTREFQRHIRVSRDMAETSLLGN